MKKLNAGVVLIFIFALLIRFIALNQSLWLDEAVTANAVKNFNFFQIIGKFSVTDFHPPLYYLLMKLWTNVFGYGEVVLRLPSVLFSLLTGYFVYKIAKLLNGCMAGLWSALFFLFNPLIIYYSQEARMYMMATFLLTVALYFFIRTCHPEFISGSRNKFGMTKDKALILVLLFFILSLLTFYGSIFLIVPMMLYFLYKKQYKNLFISLFILFIYFLLISPLLYQQLINSKILLGQVSNWSLVLGKTNLKNLLLIPIKFSTGRISFHPKWIYYFTSGIWTIFIFFILFNNLKFKIKNSLKIENLKLKIMLLYLFIFPLLLGFLISFFVPMLQYFRFLYLIPIACILLGFRTSGQAKFNRGGYVLAGGFVLFSFVYLLLPQFHREDWKSLVESLPKDRPVYMITASSDPVNYYSNDIKIKELAGLPTSAEASAGGRVNELLEKEIIVIPYSAGVYGLDYKDLLNKNSYKLKKEVSFREVTYEQWSR